MRSWPKLLVILLISFVSALAFAQESPEKDPSETFWQQSMQPIDHQWRIELGWGGYNWDILGDGFDPATALRVRAGFRWAEWFGSLVTVDYSWISSRGGPLLVESHRTNLSLSTGLERWFGAVRVSLMPEIGVSWLATHLEDSSDNQFQASAFSASTGIHGGIGLAFFQSLTLGLDAGARLHDRRIDSHIVLSAGWLF